MHDHFGPQAAVTPRNILLTETQAKEIGSTTGLEVKERIFSFFTATDKGKVVGYAALLVRRIRTKDQAAVYFISPAGRLEAIELVAFYEPREFKPRAEWLTQFKGKDPKSNLALRQEIRVVTGATLTAQSFVQGARLVLAIWDRNIRAGRP